MGYTLTFVSLRANRTYNLLINGGGTAVDGAATTFETQEENGTDMFMPVRTQSGSFRFIGSGTTGRNAWLGMIPTDALSVPVKLTHSESGSTVIDWQGYVTPQVFQNDYPYNGTSEHEMQVQCPLSVLGTIDIDTDINSHPVVTVGNLIHTYIFSNLTGTTVTSYYFQGTLTVNTMRLNTKLMWGNFLDTDSQGATKAKYTCKQLLEEVCKFFGWTCRICGTSVYFTMPVDNTAGFSYFTPAQMSNPAQGSYVNRNNLKMTLTNAMFTDTDNNEQIVPGIGNVTVRSDINELDNLIEIPYEELYDRYNRGIPAGTAQDPRIIIRSVDWYSHHLYNLIRQPDANDSHLIYENDTVSLDVYMQGKPGVTDGAGNQKRYARFFVFDANDVGDDLTTQRVPESKGAFNWVKCIELFHSYNNNTPSNTTPLFKISSKQVFVLSDGMIYVNFRCQQVSAWLVGNDVAPTYPKAKCRLKIGTNTYWNGSIWVQSSSPVDFDLSFTSEGAKTNRPDYIQQYGGDIVNVPQYDGYGVRVQGTKRGIVEFTVVDVYPFVTVDWSDFGTPAYINGFLPLHDFEIGFVRGSIEDTKHRGNEFIMRSGNFNEETNVDLIFASDYPYGEGNYIRHMPAGLGYILNNSDEKPAATIYKITDDGASVVPVTPEEELCRIISVYGQTTHRVLQLDLNSAAIASQNSKDPNPSQMFYAYQEMSDINGFFPLAISRNWRDDITTLTLIKI